MTKPTNGTWKLIASIAGAILIIAFGVITSLTAANYAAVKQEINDNRGAIDTLREKGNMRHINLKDNIAILTTRAAVQAEKTIQIKESLRRLERKLGTLPDSL